MIVPDTAHGARLNDVQLRFLRAVSERLSLERVAEVHLFPPMRQGLMESGVAVIAVFPDAPGESAEAAPASEAEPLPDDAESANHELALDDEKVPDQETIDGDPLVRARPISGEFAIVDPAVHVSSPADEARVRRRLVIFGASYRLTLKGPDRGKWEVDIRAEADAPLITVDAVVRGMQRRSPEGADPERLTGDALRAILAPPAD